MPSPNQTAARHILEIIPLVMRILGSELRQSGQIPVPGHYALLFMLSSGPHNLSKLAHKHNVSLPTMSKTVSALVERGFVQRTRAPRDRRHVIIELTEAGQAILDNIRSQAESHIAESLTPLSPKEIEQLLAGLAILRTVFRQDNQF